MILLTGPIGFRYCTTASLTSHNTRIILPYDNIKMGEFPHKKKNVFICIKIQREVLVF